MSPLAQNALILMLAVALDRFLPEPPNMIHPVVWMGRASNALERIAPRRPAAALVFGGAIVLTVVGGSWLAAWLSIQALKTLGEAVHVVGGALILRTAFTVTGLMEAAGKTRRYLDRDRHDQARASLRSLVGRDPAVLTPSLMAAAAIESVAENTTDSYVGPWVAFAVFGIPAAVAYRATNTLDSMIGYRGAYEYLGKFSARLDDFVNLVPARLSALLLLVSGVLGRSPVGRGWRIMLRDRRLASSPNAGWTMSAMAGLLGTRLEKPGHYCMGQELNRPSPPDIDRSVAIARQAAALVFLTALGLLAVRFAVTG